MKTMTVIVLMLGFLSNIYAQDPSAKIVGVWYDEEKASKIEIYKVGDSYSGKIVWMKEMEINPDFHPKDKNNPKPELRSRNILGMDIITGLKYASGKWVNGTIYTPKRGIYAKCQVSLSSNGQLKVKGSKSGFTKTQTWTRL